MYPRLDPRAAVHAAAETTWPHHPLTFPHTQTPKQHAFSLDVHGSKLHDLEQEFGRHAIIQLELPPPYLASERQTS